MDPAPIGLDPKTRAFYQQSGVSLDWDRLLRRFGDHSRSRFAHLVTFGFAYPAEWDKVPARILAELSARLADVPAANPGTE